MTTIKIKKGADTPSGLTFGELAYDVTNKRLFIGITGGNALLANTDGGVASFNGLTGAVTGVSSIRGITGTVGITNGTGIGLSVSGQTMTFSNTGVLSIDGGTGAITNVVRNGTTTTFSIVPAIPLGTNAQYTNQSIIFTEQYNYESTTLQSAPSNSSSNTVTLPTTTGTIALTNGTVASFNGITGAVTGVTTGVANTFGPLQSFTSGISASGATFSGNVALTSTSSHTGLASFAGGISAAGGTFSGDIAVNGGDITTTSTSATLFNANTTTLDILNTQSSGFTLNIGTATSYSGTKRINIGGNVSAGASSDITLGTASTASKVSILGGVTLGGIPGAVVRVNSSSFDVSAISTFSNTVAMSNTSSHTGLASFAGGLSASSGVTFGTNISVNSISVGRGKGNVTTNTALGTGVLSVLTPDEDYFIGTFNTGLGSQALNNLTTGQRNTAVGKAALYSATTSSYNTAVGALALYTNTTGSYNTAIGEESLRYNTTGIDNVGIGYDTLTNLTTANYNTAVGVGAGRARGSGNAFLPMISATGGIFIGHQARGSTSGQTNEIVIGRDAVGLGSNTTVLGATSAVSATIYGLVNAPSGISAAGSTFSGNVNLQDNTLSRVELLDYCERFVDLGNFTSSGTQIPIDLSTGQVFRTKLTVTSTGLNVTNTPDNGNANTVGFNLLFVGDGTARTMTWNIGSTAIGWAGGIAPTYTSTSNKIDVYSFLTRDGGSNWLGFVGGQNF